VGQTTRNVKRRIAEQVKTAAIRNYRIELNEPAERDDGSILTDHEVRTALARKGFENTELEWMRCTIADGADSAVRAADRPAVHRHPSPDVQDAP